MKRRLFNIGNGILAFVLLSIIVSAFGITTPHTDKTPLIMAPGSSIDIKFLLQNMLGGEDIVVQVDIMEGNEVARIIDESNIYDIPFGTEDIPVNIRVSVPRVSDGTTYTVAVQSKTIPKPGKGAIQFGTGAIQRFPVIVRTAEVIEEPVSEAVREEIALPVEQKGVNIPLLVVIALIIAVIIYLIVMPSLTKKSKKR